LTKDLTFGERTVVVRCSIARASHPVIFFDSSDRVDREARARNGRIREERLSYQDNRMHAHSHDHASRYLLSAVHNARRVKFFSRYPSSMTSGVASIPRRRRGNFNRIIGYFVYIAPMLNRSPCTSVKYTSRTLTR